MFLESLRFQAFETFKDGQDSRSHGSQDGLDKCVTALLWLQQLLPYLFS